MATMGTLGLVSAGLLAVNGIGSADPVSLTLDYECPFPLIGVQQVSITINTDMPAQIDVGEPSPAFDIHAVANSGTDATDGLRLIGAKTIEGTSLAGATVRTPEGALSVTVEANIPPQDVPPSGSDLIVEAFGNAPSLTFNEAGIASITVGDIDLTLTPRDGEGNETQLGTFDAPCTQVPGQDNELHRFTIGDGGDEAGWDDDGDEGEAAGGGDTGGADEGGTDEGEAAGGADAGGADAGGADAGGDDGGGADGGAADGSGDGDAGDGSSGGDDGTAAAPTGGGQAGAATQHSAVSKSKDALAQTGSPVLIPAGIGLILAGLGWGMLLMQRRPEHQ